MEMEETDLDEDFYEENEESMTDTEEIPEELE